MTVFDALSLKHPDPCVPPDYALPSMDNLPFLEDSEITGSHILSVAHQLQEGAGLGGCDASSGVMFCFVMVSLVLIYMTL